jgi:hypothetical protein
MQTPFFPAWRARLSPLKAVLQKARSEPLPSPHHLFASALPENALWPSGHGAHSRQRVFTLGLTFWAFLSQVLSPGTSCREVVRQVQSLRTLHGKEGPGSPSSAYCQARLRLPLNRLWRILGFTVQNLRRKAGHDLGWFGREVKVVDGSSCTLPDTLSNQKAFPQPREQEPGLGFPLMKFVGLFSLHTGALLSAATGSLHQSELFLFRKIWNFLKSGDVLVADRLFSDFGTITALWQRGVDSVFRLHQARARALDFRQGDFLGKNDRLVQWFKPAQRPRTIQQRLWARLPQDIYLRLIRFKVEQKGFRTREIILVTTLLDPRVYPAEEIARLYLKRWSVELFFRDIKSMLKMEHLRGQSPAMVERELVMHLIAYNLIRTVMWEALRRHDVPLERLSFKGSLDAVRQYSAVLARAKSEGKAAALVRDLLKTLASDLVPLRPGRREPRALKRRPKPYALLTKHRHHFKEIPHKNKYSKKTNPLS